MRETPADLDRLQAILDSSYDRAGTHLASIHTPDRRLGAADLAARLTGMCLLTVATVTADGRPLARPVDGFFFRGEFWFGSGPESLAIRHLRVRPAVSAVHTAGESLGVTVHGEGRIVDVGDAAHAGFGEICREFYGPAWDDWGAGAVYARIEADRILTFSMEPESG